MELKRNKGFGFVPRYSGFNRTFMELKLMFLHLEAAKIMSFNRTFMELKHLQQYRQDPQKRVLIVPLWN